MRRAIHLFSLIFFLLSMNAPFAHAQTAFEAFMGQQDDDYKDVVVRHVSTVNDFVLDDGTKVRMIGIKAPDLPEKVKVEREVVGEMGFTMTRTQGETDPTDTIEEEAFDFVRDLLEGAHVRLEFDNEQKTDDHKTWAYVYLLKDNTFVNAAILKQGYAFLSIRPPNTKHEDALREAYQEARQERRGLQGQ